ncbi:hypothetical protein PENSUB_579 [Aspergillus terreus]|uniref:Uncharacterized protein n=1 Tax=Aspergillus terreus TaxID=33178 RepID=A0A5M3Z760_ASPTE|nr:hypothetical protein ATETN484_0008035900 [Aspergillus terreus]GFF21187.1 hypothetical protein PENSUB_579 [Aspergillus terreus]
MPANFFTLPGELRNQIYHLLTSAEPVNPWSKRGHNLATNLIRTNKTIQREAAWVLYGGNIFDFRPPVHLLYEGDAFLDRIGPHNARHIRHIQFDMFLLLFEDPREYRMFDAILRMFSKIQSDCSNLKTLVVSQVSFTVLEILLSGQIDAAGVIADFDARARTIASLEGIILDVPRESQVPYLREKMEGHGWKFKG